MTMPNMRVYYRSKKPGGNQLHRIDVAEACHKKSILEVQNFLLTNKLKYFGTILAVIK